MTPNKEWYEKNYPHLSGNGLWLRGQEPNRLPLDEYNRRECRVLISRLSTFEDTAESSTQSILYALASCSGLYPDIAFLPPSRDAELMEGAGVPWLLGTATKRGPTEFSVIALSNSIVQELLSLPMLLSKSGIPLEKSKRLLDPRVPLILLGGANALHSSLIWTSDPPVDGIFLGGCPHCIREMFTICKEGVEARLSKQDLLSRLERVPGFFQPERPVSKEICTHKDCADTQCLDQRIGSLHDEQIDRGAVQISEGCPAFCSFCAESFSRKPYREDAAGSVISKAHRLKALLGLRQCDLYSFNFNLYAEFAKVLPELVESFEGVGLKSQRFEALSLEPSFLPSLIAVGKNNITCGLEGISARMRRFLHKGLDETLIRRSLALLLAAPLRELKIFLIATGLEEQEDFDEFRSLIEFCVETARSVGKRPRVIFSLTPLVRFPWTPLEFDSAQGVEHGTQIIGKIGSIVRSRQLEFRQAMDLSEWWISQLLVRAEDPRIWESVVRTTLDQKFVYYRELPAYFVETLQKSLAERGIDRVAIFAARDPSQPARWSELNPGISRTFLAEQYKKAQRFEDQPMCLGGIDSEGACLGCGACQDTEAQELLTHRRGRQALNPARIKDRIALLRKEEVSLSFLVTISNDARGLPRKLVSSAVAAALMQEDASLIPLYRRTTPSYWAQRDGEWITGQDIIYLTFRKEILPKLSLLGEALLSRVNQHISEYGVVNRYLADQPPYTATLSIVTEYPFSPDYLRSLKLSFTEKRQNSDCVYDFSKDSIKKQLVTNLTVCKESTPARIELTIGPKLSIPDFFKGAFVLPEKDDWVRIASTATLIR